MREKVGNYKRLHELVKEWVDLAIEVERWERTLQHQSASLRDQRARPEIQL